MSSNLKPQTSNFGGFTLIEVLIVAVITIAMTASLVTNFSRTRSALPRTAVGIVNDIRLAQSRATSGTLHEGVHRCGYGVSFEAQRYIIYAGPEPDILTGCATDNHLYDPGGIEDAPVFIGLMPPGLVLTPGDVYFEPPFPTTYIGGLTDQSLTITLQESGANCPSPGCRIITINAAGQIQSQ